MTYNMYVTKGLEDGSIHVDVVEGIRIARVRRPRPDEEVVGYVNFSSFLYTEHTPTEIAARGDNNE